MNEKTRPLNQPLINRESGAEAACALTEAISPASVARKPTPAATAAAVVNRDGQMTTGCSQRVTVAFFFDGTGNNIDADKGTGEHSNVARLFRAHPDNDEPSQTYRRYIPGLGTYFREINDPGGTTLGQAFGAWGQSRLDWAFKELAQLLAKAEARAGNPSNKIVDVRISVFGFSRGAALARAFCRDLQKAASGQRGQFKVRGGSFGNTGITLHGGYPVDVYFLGLFDTVASVGVPLSANNTLIKRRHGLSWRDLRGLLPVVQTVAPTGGEAERDLHRLAFGLPGADPAPGPASGHGAWGDDLRVADIVTKCVHMVAAHEMRNSFPLDSVLDGSRYPDGTLEMVYPGVHSDVGGGYRQGEGGKSALLSQLPLRAMLEKAIEAKVPLLPLTAAKGLTEQKDFAADEEGQKAYVEVSTLWFKYMKQISTEASLGETVLSHMRRYWMYRLTVARQRSDPAHAAVAGRGGHERRHTMDQAIVVNNEKIFSAERAKLQKEVTAREAEYRLASTRRETAEQTLQAARLSGAFANQVPMWRAQFDREARNEALAQDQYLTAKARLDTSANDSELIEHQDDYDASLLEDAALISKWHRESPGERMRPHYRAVVDACDEVITRNRPMDINSDEFKFFSLYVHDSLSAFAKDNTRTSDPRVIYIAGDVKYRYAVNTVPQDQQTAEA